MYSDLLLEDEWSDVLLCPKGQGLPLRINRLERRGPRDSI